MPTTLKKYTCNYFRFYYWQFSQWRTEQKCRPGRWSEVEKNVAYISTAKISNDFLFLVIGLCQNFTFCAPSFDVFDVYPAHFSTSYIYDDLFSILVVGHEFVVSTFFAPPLGECRPLEKCRPGRAAPTAPSLGAPLNLVYSIHSIQFKSKSVMQQIKRDSVHSK